MKPARILITAILALMIGSTAIAQEQAAQSAPAAPWRVAASLAGTTSGGGLVLQAAVSHDHLLGPLGVRLAAEYGFGVVPLSVTAGVLETAPLGPVDIHAGLGVGASFEATGVLTYAELLLGTSYRFTDNLGAYLEGRFRPYFDGTAEGVAGVAAGLQLRF